MSSRSSSRRAQEPPRVYGPIRAYHWLKEPDKLMGGEPTCVGKTHVLPDGQEPILCRRGFHASASFEVSLSYAPGLYLTRVELSGHIYGRATDKYVASRRRVLWMFDVRPLLWEFAKPRLEAALEKLKETFPTLPPEFAQALVQLEEGYADGSLPSRNGTVPEFLSALRDVQLTDASGETGFSRRWYNVARWIEAVEYVGRIYGLSHTLSNLSPLPDAPDFRTLVAEFEAFIRSKAPEEPPLQPTKRRWTPDMPLRRRKTSKKAVALGLTPQAVTPALVKRIVRLASVYQERNQAYADAQVQRDNQYYARNDLLHKLPDPSAKFSRYYGYGYRSASESPVTLADVDDYLTEAKRAARAVKKALPKVQAALDAAVSEMIEKEARVGALKALYIPLHSQVQALTPKQRSLLHTEVLNQWSVRFPAERSRLIDDLF